MDLKNPTLKDLIRPRFWPLWLALATLRLLILLPFSLQLTFGRKLGRVFYRLAPERAQVARRNIEHCFPEQTPEQHEALTRAHFEAIGISVFETGLCWWAADKKVKPLLSQINGLDHLLTAQAEGKGVILLCSHFTTLEIASRLLVLHAPFAAVYRQLNNPLLEYVTARGRGKHTNEMIPKDNIKRMIQLLRKGQSIWFAADQNYQRKNSELVNFFGQPAPTATVIPSLTRTGKALVMPFNIARIGSRYEINILPPLDNFPSGDDIADTERYHHIIEAQVRRIPEQYLWVHRRFKGAPSFEYES